MVAKVPATDDQSSTTSLPIQHRTLSDCNLPLVLPRHSRIKLTPDLIPDYFASHFLSVQYHLPSPTF